MVLQVLAEFLVSLSPSTFFRLIKIAGFLNYLLNIQKRKMALQALATTFPGRYSSQDLIMLCRRHFIIRSSKYFHFLVYPLIKEEWLDQMMRVTGMEHIEAALNQGSGVLLFTIHSGDMNLIVPLISRRYRFNLIRLGRIDRVASQTSGQVFPTHRITPALYRALGRSEVTGMTIDGIAGKKLVPVTFLGQRVYVQPSIARLASYSRCSLIPFINLDIGGGHYDTIILPPLHYQEDLNYPDFQIRIMQKAFQVFESYITNDPSQWHSWPFLGIMRMPPKDRPAKYMHRD